MLAVGPLAILPSPVLATLPTQSAFTANTLAPLVAGTVIQTSGTGNLTTSTDTATFSNLSDRSVLVWGPGTFNIGALEQYTFLVNGGSVLNKVGYLASGALSGADTATINGRLFANGKVLIMANGSVLVGGGASITTTGGLVLSTLSGVNDPNNFNFSATGDLPSTGTSTGPITIGTGALVNASGSVTAYSGSLSVNNLSVSGDLILNQSTSAAGVGLVVTGAGGPTTVTGNFTATTNAGAISQGAGALNVAAGTTTLNTNGNATVTLGGANDFNNVLVSAGTGAGGIVTLNDINSIVLGNSTIGQSLTVTAVGNITTAGVVNSVGTTSLTVTGAGNLVNYGTGSSAGTFSASTISGPITFNGVNAVSTGVLSTGASNGDINITSTGAATINGAITTAGGNITVTSPSVTQTTTGIVNATANVVTYNATAGSVILGSITANTINVLAPAGSISENASGILTANATGSLATNTSSFTAAPTGSISLNNLNVLNNTTLQLTGGTVTVNNTRAIVLGTTNTTGGVTIDTRNAPLVAAGGTGNVVVGTGFGTAAQPVNIGGGLTIMTANSTINDDDYATISVLGALTLSTNNGFAGGAATTGKDITFDAADGPLGTLVRSAFGQFNAQAGAGAVVVHETTTLNLGTVSANAITANSLSGSLIQSGAVTVTGAAGASTFRVNNNTTTNITLDNPTNTFAPLHQVSIVGGNNDIVTASSSFMMRNGTNVSGGNLAITTLGAGSDVILMNGNVRTLNVNAAGRIIFSSNNANSFLAATTANLVSGDSSPNSITQNLTTVVGTNGTLTLQTNGGILLDGLNNNITGNVVLNNVVGDATIFNRGNLTVSGSAQATLNITAGTAGANAVSRENNLILGNLNVRGNLNAATLNGNTTQTASFAVGNVSAVTLVSGGAGYTATPTVTISAPNINGGTQATATATMAGGVVTGITFTAGSGAGYTSPPTITFSASGATTPASASSTVNFPLGTISSQTIPVPPAPTVPLTGTITSGNLIGGNTFAGESGNITQLAGTRLHVENQAEFVTFHGNIIVANNGNNAGRLNFSTGGGPGLSGNADIRYSEDGTAKIGNIATNGNATITSRFGSIIEDPLANDILNVGGTLALNAPTGSILLGNTTHTSGTTTGNVANFNIATNGAAAIISSGNITLGTTAANSLTVTANNIGQSAPLFIFGPSTFNATNSITLTNAANNFGPITTISATANQSIAVTESGTLNLRSVSMPGGGNGTFTATSINGDVIDTGLGGVRLGGAIVGSVAAVGQGVVTLSAANGNVLIDDPTSEVLTTTGVNFNAKNVTISVLGNGGSTLVLGSAGGASNVTGNLTATSALGNIGNAGNIVVGGNAFFQTGTGNITLNQAGNQFGTLKFIGNQVNVNQVGNMTLVTGSSAIGPALLESGGNIGIVSVGGGTVNFGNLVSMRANGNITLPKLIQAVGTLTLRHVGTADLSALSTTQDLSGKSPVSVGPGTYVPPSQ